MEKDQLIINPKTKVFQLLEAYPQLEETLIEYLPAFEKLKNPFLRKTVAKVATLQQAASIGKVKVDVLINHLRKEIGQELISEPYEDVYTTSKPDWFNENSISEEFDINEMLAAGEHPVNHVMAELKKLKAGKIYKLIAPFLPAPLIDKAASMKYVHWIDEKSSGQYFIYFIKSS